MEKPQKSQWIYECKLKFIDTQLCGALNIRGYSPIFYYIRNLLTLAFKTAVNHYLIIST